MSGRHATPRMRLMRRWATGVVTGFILAVIATLAAVLGYPRLRDFVYRETSYAVVMGGLVGAESDPKRITNRALEYVYDQLHPSGGPILDADSWTHLVRGVGWCDQADWTVGTLIALKGLYGRLALLHGADGVSPHAVLLVSLNEGWRVVDPLLGVVFPKPDGSWATLVIMVRRKGPSPASAHSKAGSSMRKSSPPR